MLANLRQIFEALRSANLTLRPSKCEFGKTAVEYLGYRISGEGVLPGTRKIAAIRDYPQPLNAKQVRQFLGLASFFRRFERNFARVATPLYDLTKPVPFRWSSEADKAFVKLKDSLVQAPVCAMFDFKRATELHTDASHDGLGAMLLQVYDDGPRLIYCISRRTSAAERNYHSTKLELLAVVWAVIRLRHYLLGSHFTIVSDCTCIQLLSSTATRQTAR